jgi:hypothetical protein
MEITTAIPPRFVTERAAVLTMLARWERETLGGRQPASGSR